MGDFEQDVAHCTISRRHLRRSRRSRRNRSRCCDQPLLHVNFFSVLFWFWVRFASAFGSLAARGTYNIIIVRYRTSYRMRNSAMLRCVCVCGKGIDVPSALALLPFRSIRHRHRTRGARRGIHIFVLDKFQSSNEYRGAAAVTTVVGSGSHRSRPTTTAAEMHKNHVS